MLKDSLPSFTGKLEFSRSFSMNRGTVVPVPWFEHNSPLIPARIGKTEAKLSRMLHQPLIFFRALECGIVRSFFSKLASSEINCLPFRCTMLTISGKRNAARGVLYIKLMFLKRLQEYDELVRGRAIAGKDKNPAPDTTKHGTIHLLICIEYSSRKKVYST